MNLRLKGFSQDVDLDNPDEFLHFLVFDNEGNEIRLPVPEETVQVLMKVIYANGKSRAEAPEAPEDSYDEPSEPPLGDDPDATVFGGESKEPEEEPEEESPEEPASEEEVPSL